MTIATGIDSGDTFLGASSCCPLVSFGVSKKRDAKRIPLPSGLGLLFLQLTLVEKKKYWVKFKKAGIVNKSVNLEML